MLMLADKSHAVLNQKALTMPLATVCNAKSDRCTSEAEIPFVFVCFFFSLQKRQVKFLSLSPALNLCWATNLVAGCDWVTSTHLMIELEASRLHCLPPQITGVSLSSDGAAALKEIFTVHTASWRFIQSTLSTLQSSFHTAVWWTVNTLYIFSLTGCSQWLLAICILRSAATLV